VYGVVVLAAWHHGGVDKPDDLSRADRFSCAEAEMWMRMEDGVMTTRRLGEIAGAWGDSQLAVDLWDSFVRGVDE